GHPRRRPARRALARRQRIGFGCSGRSRRDGRGRSRAPSHRAGREGLGRRRRGPGPPSRGRQRRDRYGERTRVVRESRTVMAGNSQRRGAIRKGGSKKGQVVGSGGQRRRGLEARGATPKAEDRPYHPAAKRARAAAKAADPRGGGGRRPAAGRKAEDGPEMVLGRNPVVECLRAGVPATALYVALGAEADERLKEAVQRSAEM